MHSTHQDSFPADVSSLMMDSMGLKKIVQSQQPLPTVRQVATVKPMVPKIGWTMDIGDKMEDCCSLESIGFIARPPALIVCQEMTSCLVQTTYLNPKFHCSVEGKALLFSFPFYLQLYPWAEPSVSCGTRSLPYSL